MYVPLFLSHKTVPSLKYLRLEYEFNEWKLILLLKLSERNKKMICWFASIEIIFMKITHTVVSVAMFLFFSFETLQKTKIFLKLRSDKINFSTRNVGNNAEGTFFPFIIFRIIICHKTEPFSKL